GSSGSVPVPEPGQRPGKRTPLKASIDVHSIVMREDQELPSGHCGNERVPPEQEGELQGFREHCPFARLELMSGEFAERTRLAIGAPPFPVAIPSLVFQIVLAPTRAERKARDMQQGCVEFSRGCNDRVCGIAVFAAAAVVVENELRLRAGGDLPKELLLRQSGLVDV